MKSLWFLLCFSPVGQHQQKIPCVPSCAPLLLAKPRIIHTQRATAKHVVGMPALTKETESEPVTFTTWIGAQYFSGVAWKQKIRSCNSKSDRIWYKGNHTFCLYLEGGKERKSSQFSVLLPTQMSKAPQRGSVEGWRLDEPFWYFLSCLMREAHLNPGQILSTVLKTWC